MDKILIIIFGSIVAITIVGVVIGVLIRKKNKNTYAKAYDILEEIAQKIKDMVAPLSSEYLSKIDIEDEKYNIEGVTVYDAITRDVDDFTFNKCSENLQEILKSYEDKKSIHKILVNNSDKEFLDNIVIDIKGDSVYVKFITDIYNKCFSDDIDRIESEDASLEKELAEYENAPVKDETQEQHNQSIEEYARAHLNEKLKELNNVYDELEKEEPKLKNVVPVRELRALTPLIDDENIIPPTDEEPDILTDDGTFEVVEYLDNINDTTLNVNNITSED